MTLAERSERPVMWLVPHFMALDVAGVSVLLFQKRKGVSIYQEQSNAVMDRALRRGRLRLGNAEIFSRTDAAKPLLRAIRRGDALLQPARHGFRRARRGLRAVLRHPGGDAARAVAARPRDEHGGAAGARRDAARRRGLPRALPASRGSDFPTDDPIADTARGQSLDRGADPAQPGAVPVGPQALQDAAARRAVAVRSATDNPAHGLRFTKMQGAGNDFVVLDGTARAGRARPTRSCAASPTGASASAPTRSSSSSAATRRASTSAIASSTAAAATRSSSAATARAASSGSCARAASPTSGRVRVETTRAVASSCACRTTAASPSTWARRCSSRPASRSTRPGSRRARSTPRAAAHGRLELWPLDVGDRPSTSPCVSMGNPHAVQIVDDVDAAPVATQGPLIERHPRFPRGVNVGFMQIVDRATASACASTSAAPARRWPAAPAPAPRSSSASASACSIAKVDVETRGGRADDRVGGRRQRRC